MEMTVNNLLDAIFNAKRLEQLQTEVRESMIQALLVESEAQRADNPFPAVEETCVPGT